MQFYRLTIRTGSAADSRRWFIRTDLRVIGSIIETGNQVGRVNCSSGQVWGGTLVFRFIAVAEHCEIFVHDFVLEGHVEVIEWTEFPRETVSSPISTCWIGGSFGIKWDFLKYFVIVNTKYNWFYTLMMSRWVRSFKLPKGTFEINNNCCIVVSSFYLSKRSDCTTSLNMCVLSWSRSVHVTESATGASTEMSAWQAQRVSEASAPD